MPKPYTGDLITPCSDNHRTAVSIASPLADMIIMANSIAGTDSAWIYLRSDNGDRFVARSHPSVYTQGAAACCMKTLASEDVLVTWQAPSASDGSSPAHFAGLRITDTCGRTFAALCVAAPCPLDLTAKQVHALQALGRQIGSLLQNERDSPYPPSKTKVTRQGREGDLELHLPNPSEPSISVYDMNRNPAGFFNLVLQSAGEGIYGIDMEGRCTFTNRVAAEMLGYTEDELLGQNIHRLAHHSRPDGSPYPVEDCPIYCAFRSGQGCRISEDVFWRRDGTSFPVEYSSFPIMDGGAITGAVVTAIDISDRRRSEESLRASEERYRVLFDACPAGYIKLNPAGQVEAWNPAAEAIFGWSAAEATAFSSLSFLIPDALWDDIERLADDGAKADILQRQDGPVAGVRALDWRHQRSGSPGTGVLSELHRDALLARLLSNLLSHRQPVASFNENVTKDGRTITCEWLNIPIYDAKGNATGFLSVVQDVTERSRAEMALKESELRFRELVENISEVFWIVSTDFHEVVYVSPAYEKIWGRTCESLYSMPRSWTDAIHPDDRDRVLALATEKADSPTDTEYRIVRADGSVRWIHDRSTPIRNEAGDFYRIAGIAEDITERKMMQEALRESQDRLQLALEAGGTGVWDLDLTTGTTVASKSYFDIVGRYPDQIGVTIHDYIAFVHPDDRKMLLEEHERARREGTPFATEYRVVHPNGTLRWVAGRGRYVFDEHGNALQMMGAVVDITERRMAQEQVKRQFQRIAALRAIDVAITGSMDLRLTLGLLLDQVLKHLEVDAAHIMLLNRSSLELEHFAMRGFRSSSVASSCVRLGAGLAGRAALEQEIVQIEDLRAAHAPFTRANLVADENFVAYMAVPLMAKGQVYGVLEIFHQTMLDPTVEWREFLEALCGQAAIAIENARMFGDLQRSNTELMLAYDETIEGWAKALDLRDHETEGHTRRVTEMAIRVARALEA